MSQPSSPARPYARLIVTGGPRDGVEMVFDTAAEKVLGSGPGCELQIELGNIEPRHARVAWGRKGMLLSDLKTSTGTYVNGERIQAEHALQDGDRVCLGPPGSKGSAKLLARLPPEAVAAMAEPVGIELAPEQDEDHIVLDTEAEPLVLVAPAVIAPPPAPPPAPTPAPSPMPATASPGAAPPERVPKPAAVLTSPPPPGAGAPPAASRRPAPEFTDELPSIGGDRVREAIDLPPAVQELALKKGKAKRKAVSLTIPPPLVKAGVGLLAVAVLFGAYRALRKPTPVIVGISPASAEAGQTVTLSGTDFAPTPSDNVARVGDVPGETVSASATQLVVKVPAGAKPGDSQQVTVESRGKRSNTVALKVYVAPKITAVEPDVALPGQEVLLRGEHLDGNLTVSVAGMPAEVKDTQGTSLRFRIPPDMPFLSGRSVGVVVQAGPTSSKPANMILGKLPLLVELVPARGRAGDRVVLKGRGFAPSPEANVVYFGEQRAVVLQATPAELHVAAPSPASASSQVQAEVKVEAGGALSSVLPFVLSRPSTGFFVPRYFPSLPSEGPAGDHLFVSTDLGPALLLTGKADAPSTAERATRTAEALNKVVDTALNKPVTFEAKEAPSIGVGLSDSPDLLVAATAEDAAGYGLPWDPAQRASRRASPKLLAQYWAAILQDHVSLFLRRERPGRVMELSPRGKPLLDIYGEALRRGGAGAGIPTSAVAPLSGSLARAFREMALLLPEGQAVAGAVATGRWRGTMEVTGEGSRPIQVVFRLEGSRLAGSMSATSGKIGMEMPLTDVAYTKGGLRFVLVLGSKPRHFAGTLQGGKIAGDIFPDAGSREAIGRFSLQFVE